MNNGHLIPNPSERNKRKEGMRGAAKNRERKYLREEDSEGTNSSRAVCIAELLPAECRKREREAPPSADNDKIIVCTVDVCLCLESGGSFKKRRRTASSCSPFSEESHELGTFSRKKAVN